MHEVAFSFLIIFVILSYSVNEGVRGKRLSQLPLLFIGARERNWEGRVVRVKSRREDSRIAKRRRGLQKLERRVRTLLLVFRSSSSALHAIPRPRPRPRSLPRLHPTDGDGRIVRILLCWIWRDVYPPTLMFPFFLLHSVSLFFAYRHASIITNRLWECEREVGWNSHGRPNHAYAI